MNKKEMKSLFRGIMEEELDKGEGMDLEVVDMCLAVLDSEYVKTYKRFWPEKEEDA